MFISLTEPVNRPFLSCSSMKSELLLSLKASPVLNIQKDGKSAYKIFDLLEDNSNYQFSHLNEDTSFLFHIEHSELDVRNSFFNQNFLKKSDSYQRTEQEEGNDKLNTYVSTTLLNEENAFESKDTSNHSSISYSFLSKKRIFRKRTSFKSDFCQEKKSFFDGRQETNALFQFESLDSSLTSVFYRLYYRSTELNVKLNMSLNEDNVNLIIKSRTKSIVNQFNNTLIDLIMIFSYVKKENSGLDVEFICRKVEIIKNLINLIRIQLIWLNKVSNSTNFLAEFI